MKIINPYRFTAVSGALLLDETGLGSAYAAYSVARKLRDAYAGSALRVRRSSDDAEQDIGFSNNALDESALTTFVGANNGFVVTFYDQSGNGYDATAPSTAAQGQIVQSGTVVSDGTGPAILLTSDTAYRYTGGGISSSTLSLSVVCNTGTSDGTNSLKTAFGVGTSTTDRFGAIAYGEYNSVTNRRKPALHLKGRAAVVSAATNTSKASLIGFINGTAGSLYENDLTEVSGTYGGTLNLTSGSVRITEDIVNSFRLIDDYWQEGVAWLSDLEAYVATIKSNVNAFYSIY